MIIACEKCNKQFNVDSNLIPGVGRLLQCNGCNYEWFFKPKIKKDPIENIKDKNNQSIQLLDKKPNPKVDFDNNIQEVDGEIEEEKILDEALISKKKKKKISILNLLIVFIISFVTFIIILDTFKSQINKIFPYTEIFLYNLYETLKDIMLFTKDLL
jgi:predicted Zn finger-like uncharacterized protein